MNKQVVLDGAPPRQPLYAHLDPVVDFLVANGNALAYPYRWGSDREGYFCVVARPIAFADLLEAFQFPPTVLLTPDLNQIYCEKTGALIRSEVSSD
ncbi:hypothetical protein ACQ858_22215 [Variovorax ureilyticus]|uniref:hypothetical protein n=1 Tax=Variovorax ureilyticus TaxID=1836198 RepID=UPI003D6782B7